MQQHQIEEANHPPSQNANKRKKSMFKHHSSSPPALQDAYKHMKDALETFNSVVYNKQSDISQHDDDEDECELYGKLIVKKLRKFPDHVREELMYEIDGLILKKGRQMDPSGSPYSFSSSSLQI